MKKLTSILLILIMGLGLTSCGLKPDDDPIDCELYPDHASCVVDEEPGDYLDIYYINDFHGAILPDSDQLGMAYIANYIITKKTENPDNVLVLAGGDILQGSALSNHYLGLSTINMLNEMYFDAYAIGNHEFDWGLETVTNYFDDNEDNGEANFPLLGANVFFEGTTDIPDGIEPYTIVERGGLKIGIIGTIGYGLESTISYSKVLGYEFAEPVAIIESYAYHLRTVENVDMVLVVSHDKGNINERVAALEGDYKVDAVFNGHSHSNYALTNLGIPVLQAGHNGEYLGHVSFDLSDETLSTFSAENLDFYDSDLFHTPNTAVQNLIDGYVAETDALFNASIIVAGEDLSKGDLTFWLAKLMRITTNSDIAFHNIGGTRTDIEEDEMISLSVLYEIWPFDNVIKTTWLTGKQINNFKATYEGYYFDSDISYFDEETYYKVATNDYVFDKIENPFVTGQSSENTELLLRDIVVTELELQSLIYSSFLTTNDILTITENPDTYSISYTARN